MNASAATEYHVSLSMLDYELNRAAERSATPRRRVPLFRSSDALVPAVTRQRCSSDHVRLLTASRLRYVLLFVLDNTLLAKIQGHYRRVPYWPHPAPHSARHTMCTHGAIIECVCACVRKGLCLHVCAEMRARVLLCGVIAYAVCVCVCVCVAVTLSVRIRMRVAAV